MKLQIYSNELTYMKPEYDKILLNNKDFLLNIKQIRNKYEHKMHEVNCKEKLVQSCMPFKKVLYYIYLCMRDLRILVSSNVYDEQSD